MGRLVSKIVGLGMLFLWVSQLGYAELPYPPSCLISFEKPEQLKEASKALQKIGYQSEKFHAGTDRCTPNCLLLFHKEDSKVELAKKIESVLKLFHGTIQSCVNTANYPNDYGEKPVIYLYPTQPQETLVQLHYQGRVIADFPDFDPAISGWRVLADPSGKLVDLRDGQEYSYLFWEGRPDKPISLDMSSGFVMAGQDTQRFLQNILSQIGLTPKELNEFIVYWLPRLKKNPYNFIHFAGIDYTDTAPLTITPRPDSMLRVFMVWKPLDRPVVVKPQEFSKFQRNGFTVVEWGGAELK